MTPDRKPLVGPVKRLAGFVQANGCNGRGFLLGPLIGELLARWLDSGERRPCWRDSMPTASRAARI
jgi:Glycine/D-amino acid oxidases (deaminating)